MSKKGAAADKYRVLSPKDVSNFFKEVFDFNHHEQEYFLDVTMYDRSCVCTACVGRALENGETTKVTNKAEERRQLRLLKQEETRRAQLAKEEYERKALYASSKITAFFRMIGPRERWRHVRLLNRQFKRKRAYIVCIDQYTKPPQLEHIRPSSVLAARAFKQLGFETELWTAKSLKETQRPTRENLENLLKVCAAAPPEDLVVLYITGRGGRGVIPGVMPVKKQNESRGHLTPRARLRDALRIHNKVTTGDASALRYLCPSNVVKPSADTVFRIDDLMEVVSGAPQEVVGHYSCPTAQRLLLVDLYETASLPPARPAALPETYPTGSYALVASTVTSQIAWEVPHGTGMLTYALLRALHGFATTQEEGLTVTSIVKRIYRDFRKVKALPTPEVKELWYRGGDASDASPRGKDGTLALRSADVDKRDTPEDPTLKIRNTHPWHRVLSTFDGANPPYLPLMLPDHHLVPDIVSGAAKSAKLPSPAARLGLHRTPLSKRMFVCITLTTPTSHRPLPQGWLDDIVDYIQTVTQNQESRIMLGSSVDTKQVRITTSTSFADLVDRQRGMDLLEKVAGIPHERAEFEKEENGDATLVLHGVAEDADFSAFLALNLVKDMCKDTGDVTKLYLFTNARVVLSLTGMIKQRRGNLAAQAQTAAEEQARSIEPRHSRALSVIDRFQRLKNTTVTPTVVGVDAGTHNIMDVCEDTFNACEYLVVLIITGDTQKAKATQLLAGEAVAKNYDPHRMPFYYLDSNSFRSESRLAPKGSPVITWLSGIHAASYPLPSSCFPQVFLCDRTKCRHYTYSVDKAKNATASTLTHFIEEMHKGNLEDLIPPVKGSKVSGWGSSSSKYVLLPPFEIDLARGVAAHKVKPLGGAAPQY